MADRRQSPRSLPPQTFPAETIRSREIILRARTQQAIFIAGLIGAILLTASLDIVGWLGR